MNEKERLVRNHLIRLLSEMMDDERCLLSRKIKDGIEQYDSVWRMVEEAEHRARLDMINDLADRMTKLSDIDPEHRLGCLIQRDAPVLFEREPEIPTPWPN
jgi:hypothetical protein